MQDALLHPEPGQCSDALADAMWEQRCGLLFKAWVQVRYHRRRQRFFDLADKATKSATVVLGASLMGQYFRDLLPWLATAITSLGLLALVFSYGDRKQQHKELAEQAAALVAAVELVPAGALAPDGVAAWGADYARLCAKSPPPLKTLSLLCEAEQSAADGHPLHVSRPALLRRWTADFKS
jgi:hypothetical protein